ncbi:MAG: ERF family protein [Roseinatronobacter sp.]
MNAQTTIEVAAKHRNVFCALAAAQMEMEPVLKGAINPAFKGEGKPKGTAYADLADVVEAVRGPLNKHGMAYFHQIIDGSVMRTSLVHGETETRIDCDVPLLVDRQNMQGMKSATTYAKRIGLESVTGVAPEDDDGNAAAAAAPKAEPRKAAQKQPAPPDADAIATASEYLTGSATLAELKTRWSNMTDVMREIPDLITAKDARKNALTEKEPT